MRALFYFHVFRCRRKRRLNLLQEGYLGCRTRIWHPFTVLRRLQLMLGMCVMKRVRQCRRFHSLLVFSQFYFKVETIVQEIRTLNSNAEIRGQYPRRSLGRGACPIFTTSSSRAIGIKIGIILPAKRGNSGSISTRCNPRQ